MRSAAGTPTPKCIFYFIFHRKPLLDYHNNNIVSVRVAESSKFATQRSYRPNQFLHNFVF